MQLKDAKEALDLEKGEGLDLKQGYLRLKQDHADLVCLTVLPSGLVRIVGLQHC